MNPKHRAENITILEFIPDPLRENCENLSHDIPNQMEWQTNSYKTSYHPVHFDGHGNCIDPEIKSKKDKPANPDSDSSKESYIGQFPLAHLHPEFDICIYIDPKTKEYSCWYHSKPNEQPLVGLVYAHVAHFYCMKIGLLDYENHLQELKSNDC